MNSSNSADIRAKILARAKAGSVGTPASAPIPEPTPLDPFTGLTESSHGRHAGDVVRTVDGVVCTVRGFKRVCGGVVALCEGEDGAVVRLGRFDLLRLRVITRHDAGKGAKELHAPGYNAPVSGPRGGGSGGVPVLAGGVA